MYASSEHLAKMKHRETNIGCHCSGLHVFESFCLALFLCFAISLSTKMFSYGEQQVHVCVPHETHAVDFCNTCFETEDKFFFFTSLLEHHSMSQSSQTHQRSPHRTQEQCPHAHSSLETTARVSPPRHSEVSSAGTCTKTWPFGWRTQGKAQIVSRWYCSLPSSQKPGSKKWR